MRGTKKAHSPVLRIDYNEAASELPVPVGDEVIDFLTRADALDRHIANRKPRSRRRKVHNKKS
jgi:hypothetical protein